jgi:hypothetical protein
LGVQAPDHWHRQWAAARQHFIDAVQAADHGFEIARRQPLLVHAEFDRLDRIGGIDRVVPRLVGLHQGGQHIQTIAVGCAQLRVRSHQCRNFGKRRSDPRWFEWVEYPSSSLRFNGLGIDCVVRLVRADDIDEPQRHES